MMIPIAGSDDSRLDDFRSLHDHGARRRLEAGGGFFMVEGWESVRRLVSSGCAIRSILVTEDKAARLATDRFATDLGARFPIYAAPKEVVNEVVGFDLHRGVIASAERPQVPEWGQLAARATRVAVLEGINDSENLGAVFRSAAALGIDGVLLDPTVPDPLYRRTVRVSMGAAFLIPFARMTPWPESLKDLKALGFTLLAMAPDPTAQRIEDVPIQVRPAVMLGSEGEGLSESAMDFADVKVQIGQIGDLDSLNVGHAAAIAFHRFGGA